MTAVHRSPGLRGVRLTPRRRHLAAIITIALSTAFVAVMVLAGGLVRDSLGAGAAADLRGTDVVMGATDEGSAPRPIPRPEVPGATAVWPVVDAYAQMRSGTGTPAFVQLRLDPPPEAAPTPLSAGRAARTGTEIVLDRSAADAVKVDVGGTVTLPAATSPTGQEQRLTVVGIAQPTRSAALVRGLPSAHLTSANAAAILGPDAGTSAPTWRAALGSGTDPAAVAATMTRGGVPTLTAADAQQAAVNEMMRGAASLGLVAAGFVLIALITSAVVIANTFAVTLAQRVRSLALLRTLGARRGQVARVVLRESLAVGLIGSLAGMVLGHLVVQAALAGAAAVGLLPGLPIIPIGVLSVLLPLLVGVAVTLLAGLGPIRSATRVAPLQALRSQSAPAGGRERFGVRGALGAAALLVGLVSLGAGVALSHAGTTGAGVLLAMAGGALSFTGILVGLVTITRPLGGLVGRLAGRLGGLPARIAATNTARSPRRSAATIAALLIGTTLMTMMAVGARTADASLTRNLASRTPFDVVITADRMPADAKARVAGVSGVGAVEQVRTADLDVGARQPMTVLGAAPAQIDAVAARDDIGSRMADGTVVLGSSRAQEFGLHDGQDLTVRGTDGTRRHLRVVVDGDLSTSLVTTPTLDALGGTTARPALLARLAAPGSASRGDRDTLTITQAVSDVTATDGWAEPDLQSRGAERESYGHILSVLLGITIGLLAVAVLVALVGVANTLSLGTLERTGENALLRALGTTRGQMRAMMGWEGVLLALIGAVLGILLGAVYGVLGVASLLGYAAPLVIEVPWLQLAAVLVLSVLAGWAASVLPGRRAARVAPAQALAGHE